MIKYERVITDDEQKMLEHDLLDINDWINKAIEGKINNCAKRASLEYQGKARELGLKTIPTDMKECALNLFKLESYKNRSTRERENEHRGS